jgi:sugar/nucleoside kinase (ribokinase family)
LKAARDAQACRKPYVTVDSDFTDPIAQGAAVIVISGEYRQRRYQRFSASQLFRNYQKRCRGLVVITSGGGDILYGRRGSSIRRHRPPTIRPIDTSGAGDSFHFRAGMVYGTLKGFPDDESIRFSAGLAAMNCLRCPGVLNSPSVNEVRSFLKRRKK